MTVVVITVIMCQKEIKEAVLTEDEFVWLTARFLYILFVHSLSNLLLELETINTDPLWCQRVESHFKPINSRCEK